jgi:hypothetical protein
VYVALRESEQVVSQLAKKKGVPALFDQQLDLGPHFSRNLPRRVNSEPKLCAARSVRDGLQRHPFLRGSP